MPRYLLQYAVRCYQQFRYAEFTSLASLYGVRYVLGNTTSNETEHLTWYSCPVVEIDTSDTAALLKLASRSVLIKNVIEIWSNQVSSHQLIVKDFCDETSTLRQKYLPDVINDYNDGKWDKWRITVDVINKKVDMSYKLSLVNAIGDTGFDLPGTVSLNEPDLQLLLVEYWHFDESLGCASANLPNSVYFGKLVATGMRDQIHRYQLSNRKFIGNTSMDALLAFLMCNLAKVDVNHLILDPFVGTGSILIAAAYYESYCIGQDIDFLLLHGKGKSTDARRRGLNRLEGESVRANFEQYKLSDKYMDCLVADSALANSLFVRDSVFDAIVTDPPYGIRERSRKVCQVECGGPKVTGVNYYPPKEHYTLAVCLSDLLHLAAKKLIIGGRCVFWLPVVRQHYTEPGMFGVLSNFKLVCDCELPMTDRTARRLICVEKTVEGQHLLSLNTALLEQEILRSEHYKGDRRTDNANKS